MNGIESFSPIGLRVSVPKAVVLFFDSGEEAVSFSLSLGVSDFFASDFDSSEIVADDSSFESDFELDFESWDFFVVLEAEDFLSDFFSDFGLLEDLLEDLLDFDSVFTGFDF
ncbi:MAG: hypothetical protein R2684_07845 [Pyrinomonadaceae bacterium]